jgi:TonB-dependent starch-binding outer membrane protein SusC
MKLILWDIWQPVVGQKPLIIGILLIFLGTLVAQAQSRTITGKVDGSDGLPIAGATVQTEVTINGARTNSEGLFTITVSSRQRYLIVSSEGTKSVRLELGAATNYDIVLVDDILGLDEVVVVGYGTQRKGDVTSAISSVKAESFVKGAVVDAGQLIQGKVAGLAVVMPNGDPTSGTQIMLRGTSSLKGGTTPLVLIDGIAGSLSSIVPEDIESMDVLKDGSAAAIYGTRGANGVIIITTKRSQFESEPVIEYSGYLSVSTIANSHKADFMTAADLRARLADGYTFNGANNQDFGETTDWLGEITRTGVSQSHNLSIRGGSKNSNYVASLNYRDQEGTFSGTNNNTVTGRIDLNHSMHDGKIKVNLSTIMSEQKFDANGDGYGFNSVAYRMALIRNPTEPVYGTGGAKWHERNLYFYDNPIGYIEETVGENLYRKLRLAGSITYSPIPGLQIKGLYSKRGDSAIRGYFETKNHVSTTKYGKNGFASRGSNGYQSNLGEITVTYQKSIGDHRFTALGGYSYEAESNEGFLMQNWDFPTDAFTYNNMGTGFALTRGEVPISSSKSSEKLIGFFTRFSYSYADKYMAMLSMRREGSTKFGKDNKWGNFPGISIGWKIDKEPFMENVSVIESLKIRAGYGVTGINILEPYQSLSSLGYSADDAILYHGKWIYGLTPIRNPNPNLKWERKEEYNIGLDWALVNGRIAGAVDYYSRLTKEILWDYWVSIPPNFYRTMTANAGEIKNSGVEVLINLLPIKTSTYEWRSVVTYSSNTNKLVSLNNGQFQTTNPFFYAGHTGEPIAENTHRIDIGGPIGNFWGLRVVDIDDAGKWIIETPAGERKPVFSAEWEDRQVLGNGIPKHYLSWSNTVNYRGFDLSINMRGAFGYQILNTQRMFYENPTIYYNCMNSAFDKVYGKAVLTDAQRYVSYYIEDGDHWKVDNLTLGYTIYIKKFSAVKHFRVYASGMNLVTLTGYKGMDPEVSISGLAPGTDSRDKYPTVSSCTFGINMRF